MQQSYSEKIKVVQLPREEILFFPRNGDELEQYPSPDQPRAFKEWFEREGYILVRSAVSEKLCKAGVQAFQQEVLHDRKGFFERHASGKYERHVMTEAGFMKYPIMNLQDLPEKKYPQFRKIGLDLLTQKNIQRAISILFGEPGRMVHTMYFDGNQTTWAHRDGHYIWIHAEGISQVDGEGLTSVEVASFFILLVAAHVPGNAIKARLGHPMVLGVKVWALAHLLANNTLADLLLFGSFLLWAVLDFRAARQRDRAALQHIEPVGQPIGKVEILFHQNDGHVALGTQIFQRLADLPLDHRQIAHVDDVEPHIRHARQAPVDQPLDELHRAEPLHRQHRSEHAARQDGHELRRPPLTRHVVPRRFFSERLGQAIVIVLLRHWIAPHRLVAHRVDAHLGRRRSPT